jgi:RHS repeat-associated protein
VNGFKYVYQYKDHLGNIRLTYADSDGNGSINPNTEIISEKSYYPFGMVHRGYNSVVSANANSQGEKYQYNGKELNEELGLNWLDYGARNYDASLGRWMNIDPLAEKYYNNTPYNYVNNNPLNFIDPDGRSGVATIKTDEDGNEYVEISSKIYFYGEQSSSDFAKTTASHIQKMWNDGGGTVEIDGKSYSVKFSVTGEHVTEEKATELAESNGTNAENNFVRVTDGSDWSSSAGIKSSSFEYGGNAGVFLNYEMGGKKTTDAHEMGHGYGWYEAGDYEGGTHDVFPLDANGKNPSPGIMSARGTPVYDAYGYKGQASESKTLDPTKRAVLPSDISKLSINVSTLKANGSVNVGTASNNIYNANGTIKN